MSIEADEIIKNVIQAGDPKEALAKETKQMVKNAEQLLHPGRCSFCETRLKDCKFLIVGGPLAGICDECIGLCVTILREKEKPR